MAGVDAPSGWSAKQLNWCTWSKWRLVESPDIRAVAVAALSGTPLDWPGDADDTVEGTDPLAVGLTALARRDHAHAARVLSAAVETDPSGLCATALADVHAANGDWAAARDACERGACERGASPGAPTTAVLGWVVAAIATGSAAAAVTELRERCRAEPDNPVLPDYFALALLGRANEVRALDRDGRSIIITAAQLSACSAISAELAGVPIADVDLRRASASLAGDVGVSDVWAWRAHSTNGGVLAVVLLLSLATVVVAAVLGSVAVVVAGALVGAAGVYLYVTTHRRPVWELRAQDMGTLVTRRGD
jgi:hypothetical protein